MGGHPTSPLECTRQALPEVPVGSFLFISDCSLVSDVFTSTSFHACCLWFSEALEGHIPINYTCLFSHLCVKPIKTLGLGVFGPVWVMANSPGKDRTRGKALTCALRISLTCALTLTCALHHKISLTCALTWTRGRGEGVHIGNKGGRGEQGGGGGVAYREQGGGGGCI